MSTSSEAFAHAQLDNIAYKDQARSEIALCNYYAGGLDGSYFDSYTGNVANANNPYEITAVDLTAVSLLGMGRVMPGIVRAFASDKKLHDDCHDLLLEIPTDTALHDAPVEAIQPGSAAHELWKTIRKVNGGQNGITATKILARKRPHLLPMADTEVRNHLGLTTQDSAWEIMWSWFQDPANVAACRSLGNKVHPIRPLARSDAGQLSLLRVMDVPMWMVQKGRV